MATVFATGPHALGASASQHRKDVVRPSLWRAFIVLVLVAIQASLAVISWQWVHDQLATTPNEFGKALAFLTMSAFIGQGFLFAFWLTWTPMRAWFRLPLVFAVVYCASVAVFDTSISVGALAVVLIAAAMLEPLRLLTQWRCDYAPQAPSLNTLPRFPRRIKLRDILESVATLAALFGMGALISANRPDEMQFSVWAYLAGLTFGGLLLCIPVTLVVFSPSSRGLWIAIAIGNGVLFLLMFVTVAIFPISIPYVTVVAGMLCIPQTLCAGTLLVLKKLGWRFYSVADEVRAVAPTERLVSEKAMPRSRLWKAAIIAALVVVNGLFTVAMIRGVSAMDVSAEWIVLVVQGPGVAILIGQLVLLGMWSAWTPMPSWLRFPLIVGISFALDKLAFANGSTFGAMGALFFAALLEPMRMVTKWRCDYRPDVPVSDTLPQITLKLSLWEMFESILSWAFIFGGWRLCVAVGNGQNDFSNLLEAGLFLCLIPTLSVPAGLLVFSPRSKWLWRTVMAVVTLHFAVSGAIFFGGFASVMGVVWSMYWFGSAAVCVGTLFVLKKLGWRFYSAYQERPLTLPAPELSARLATG